MDKGTIVESVIDEEPVIEYGLMTSAGKIIYLTKDEEGLAELAESKGAMPVRRLWTPSPWKGLQ